MVIKSMSRRSGIKQLLTYLFKDEKKLQNKEHKPIVIRKNVRTRTLEKNVKEFEQNWKEIQMEYLAVEKVNACAWTASCKPNPSPFPAPTTALHGTDIHCGGYPPKSGGSFDFYRHHSGGPMFSHKILPVGQSPFS